MQTEASLYRRLFFQQYDWEQRFSFTGPSVLRTCLQLWAMQFVNFMSVLIACRVVPPKWLFFAIGIALFAANARFAKQYASDLREPDRPPTRPRLAQAYCATTIVLFVVVVIVAWNR